MVQTEFYIELLKECYTAPFFPQIILSRYKTAFCEYGILIL
jgi:hypothetical protein